MKPYWIALLGALCAPAWAQQAEQAQPRIIGGETAPAGEWPWMVQLDIQFRATNEVGLCGGALLAPGWAVTAAHCLIEEDNQGVPPGDVTVLYGSPIRNDGAPYAVSAYYVPQGFNRAVTPAFDNDIALLRLNNGPIPDVFPSLIGSAQFQDLQSRSAAERDEALTALGWGVTRPGGDTPASRLQEVQLDYVPTGTCLNQWGSGNFNTATMVCADERNPLDGQQQDTCIGDSGGPLFIGQDSDPYLVGLTSYGQVNCADELPSVYTNVGSQIGFVEAATADAGDPLVDLALEDTGERLYVAAAGTVSRTLTLANRSQSNNVTGATISVNGDTSLDVTLDGESCTPFNNPCYTAPGTLGTTLLNRTDQVALSASYTGLTTPAQATLTLNAGADQEEYRIKNNRQQVTLIFSDQADLAVSARITSSSRDANDQGVAEVQVTVRNLSTVNGADASQVTVTPSLPAGTTIRNSSVPCDTVCQVGSLAADQSTEFTLTLVTGTLQEDDLGLTVAANGGDFPTDNNDPPLPLTYTASTAGGAVDSGGGGGGGGALGWMGMLLALLVAARYRV
ncbi:trypsin-like serine protease [Alloalcanivorax marinus]|uniref:trypsin-like serine protease n=1 Tax=Alloalcanivorax marinus TaxID=1177169 RepID=UPI0021D1007D|nr:trypsin-like serine protease [Alloalcanivorax marinus]MCU5786291.1 Serine endopeptidase/trypsin-like serine proteinase family protein [Alloalcanivorax marinus]